MDLAQDQIRALDQLRTRLSQLSTAINTMRNNLAHQDPLPTWATLQADASALGTNMAELADVLTSQRQMFSAMHAYPLPSFPGPSEEVMLQGLLRKKLDPAAETWIDESLARETAKAGDHAASEALLSQEQMERLWTWAKPASREIIGPMLEEGVFEDDYTIAEREAGTDKVVTGVRHLDEVEDEEDDDDDEKMDVDVDKDKRGADVAAATQPMMPLDSILRFATRGELLPLRM